MHRPVHRFPVRLDAGPGRAKDLEPLDDAHVSVRRGGHVTHIRTSLSSQIGLYFIHAGSKRFGVTRRGCVLADRKSPCYLRSHDRQAAALHRAIALVAKRRESHPGCAEESWLRRGRPDGAKKAIPGPRARFHRKASWPGNGSPRVASLVHLLPAVRQRNVQVLPRRPHQR